jgi:hypothetical protein
MKLNQEITIRIEQTAHAMIIIMLCFLLLACDKSPPTTTPETAPLAETTTEATLAVANPNPSVSPEDGILIHVDSWKEDGWGICTPNCAGRDCGPDECGKLCGTCETGNFCTLDGQCLFGGIIPESCMAAAPCMIDCGIDTNCLSTCGQSISTENNNTFDDMIGCITTQCAQCAFAANLPNCILGCGTTTCSNTWEACLSGSLACHEVLSCMSVCDPSDATCTTSCVFNGSPTAQIQVFELNACWDEICGTNGSKTCKAQSIYEECAPNYFTCLEVD